MNPGFHIYYSRGFNHVCFIQWSPLWLVESINGAWKNPHEADGISLFSMGFLWVSHSCLLVNIQKTMENHGKSPFLMGKSTISMAIFNSYVSHYQRVVHSLRMSPFPEVPKNGSFRTGITSGFSIGKNDGEILHGFHQQTGVNAHIMGT